MDSDSVTDAERRTSPAARTAEPESAQGCGQSRRPPMHGKQLQSRMGAKHTPCQPPSAWPAAMRTTPPATHTRSTRTASRCGDMIRTKSSQPPAVPPSVTKRHRPTVAHPRFAEILPGPLQLVRRQPGASGRGKSAPSRPRGHGRDIDDIGAPGHRSGHAPEPVPAAGSGAVTRSSPPCAARPFRRVDRSFVRGRRAARLDRPRPTGKTVPGRRLPRTHRHCATSCHVVPSQSRIRRSPGCLRLRCPAARSPRSCARAGSPGPLSRLRVRSRRRWARGRQRTWLHHGVRLRRS